MVKRSDGLPPNFDYLSFEDKILAEEEAYRVALSVSMGHSLDSPLLKSTEKVKEIFGD